jgi:hypothetical protein
MEIYFLKGAIIMALTDDVNTTMLVQPSGGINYGNMGGGIFGNDGLWLLLVLLLGGGWGGFGGFGMGGMMGAGMLGMDMGFGLYPWLNNSQNINDGFRDQMLNSNVTSIRDGVQGLSTQLCQCCGDMRYDLANSANGIQNSIFGAQVAIGQQLNANELASLNRSFAEQTANTQGFTNVQAQLAQNGYNQATQAADIKYTIATENCADRYEAAQNTQSIITALTAGIQSIKDDLCQDRLDAERRENANLRSELMYARGQASQVDQTAQLRASQLAANTALLNELRSCPIPAQAVYGNQPVFTCSPNNNCGCGCGNNF